MDKTESKSNGYGREKPQKMNLRYKHLSTQACYTAGDMEQFAQQVKRISSPTSANSQLEPMLAEYVRHGGPTPPDLSRTFDALSSDVKKGILVQFQGGRLVTFLPFSKQNYKNPWGSNIRHSERWRSVEDVLRYSSERRGYKFSRRRIHADPNSWVGNGPLIRYGYPVHEGDTNVACLKHMFEELGKNRDIPDISFFLNRRDFPLMRKDRCYPYPQMTNTPSKLPKNPLPILSMCRHVDYMDIPCVTHDLWKTIAHLEYGKSEFKCVYSKRESFSYDDLSADETPLLEKTPRAVFRGASTGQGVTVDTNVRLKLASMNSKLLDVGITTWNLRPRMTPEGLDTIRLEDLDFVEYDEDGLPVNAEFLTPKQQAGYRYIINAEGHVCAFRLSYELSSGSVVLLVESDYKLWFSHLLVPGVHYVPVKADMSDLISQIEWCENHLDEAQQIANNAREFYKEHLTKEGVFDHLSSLMNQMIPIYHRFRYNSCTVQQLLGKIQRSYFKKQLQARTFSDQSWFLEKSVSFTDGSRIESQNLFPMRESQDIYVSKSSTIRKMVPIAELDETEPANRHCIKIKYSIPEKRRELEHEAFVRIALERALTDRPDLKSHLVPFVGVLRSSDGIEASLWEYVEGCTLHQWLTSADFDLVEFVDILCQICGVLHGLQEACAFSHADLYPYNILLTKGEKQTRRYPTRRGCIVSSGTYHVRLIDYGKSQLMVQGKKRYCMHGTVRPFYFSRVLDVITLVVTCIGHKLSTRVDGGTLGFLFKMSSFFSGSVYCPTHFQTVSGLKSFVRDARKYTEMLYSEKGELESKSPFDFIDHLEVSRKLIHDRKIQTGPYVPCFLYKTEELESFDEMKKVLVRISEYVRVHGDSIDSLTQCRINTFKKLGGVIVQANILRKIYSKEDERVQKFLVDLKKLP